MKCSRDIHQCPWKPTIFFSSPDSDDQPLRQYWAVYRPWEKKYLSVLDSPFCQELFHWEVLYNQLQVRISHSCGFYPQTWKRFQRLKLPNTSKLQKTVLPKGADQNIFLKLWNTKIVPTEKSHLSLKRKKRKHPDLGSILDQCAKSSLINKRVALDDRKPHPHERPHKLSWCWQQQGLGPFGVQECSVRLWERDD